jgi:hypothetical protein
MSKREGKKGMEAAAEDFAADFPPAPKPTRKIAITGTTPTRTMAPWHDPSWEKWTIGPGGSDDPNMPWDAIFELHGQDTWPRGLRRQLDKLSEYKVPPSMVGHLEALKALAEKHRKSVPEAFDGYVDLLKNTEPVQRTTPDGRIITKRVFTFEHLTGSKANVVYPKLYMQGKWGKRWFTSQVPWAIALALEEGATDIGIYGVDMESSEEYVAQLDGCRFFIDVCRFALGINVHLPANSGLLRDPNPYPDRWETQFALMCQDKLQRLNGGLNEIGPQIRNLELQQATLVGERNAFDYIVSRYIHHNLPLD